MMDKRIIAVLAVAIIAIAGVGIYAAVGNGGGSDTNNGSDINSDLMEKNARIYLIDGDQMEYKVKADYVKDALSEALPGIEITSAGQVKAVNGQSAGDGKAWTVWEWSSVDKKWGMIKVTKAKETSWGTNIAVVLSDVVTVDGETTYSPPGFDVVYDVYFFIQFKEQYNENPYVTSYLSESQRKEGVWVRGTGADAADALEDVATRLGWDLEMSMKDGFKGWLVSYFGLEDVTNPDGTYTYWSQYQWVDGEWKYNSKTLGGCELSDSPYFALIRQTTDVKGGESSLAATPASIPSGI